MVEQRDVIDHIHDEDNDFYTDDDLFSISSWGADLSFRELIDRYKDGELLKPELQRKYVWDKAEASRFIDSILLGLPIPSIFLAKMPNERMLIIDGYQRIMTVSDYVRGIFTPDGKVFRLSRTDKVNPRWHGKAFTELTDQEQRRIKNTTIHSIIFVQEKPQHDNTSVYQIFERINTSGRTLLPQEIRNCIYQGPLNSLLFELNRNLSWRKMYGLVQEDNRMRDMEYILRFFALDSELYRKETEEKESISLKKFLNQYMKANQDPSDPQLKSMRARFVQCVELLDKQFEGRAFHNISPTDPTRLVNKFSPTICDSIMIATDIALRKRQPVPGDIAKRRLLLLQDEQYKRAISVETMRVDSIKTRISKALSTLYGLAYE